LVYRVKHVGSLSEFEKKTTEQHKTKVCGTTVHATQTIAKQIKVRARRGNIIMAKNGQTDGQAYISVSGRGVFSSFNL